jgi:hypothetical protein
MKRFLKPAITLTAIILVMFLAAGCCCPFPFFTGDTGTQDKVTTTQKETPKTNDTTTEPPHPLDVGSGATNFVKNGSFAEGLTNWTTRTQPGSKVAGDNSISVGGANNKFLEMTRTNGGKDGGGAFASQDVNVNVSAFTSVIYRLSVNVISEYGGNIANNNPKWFPEGACQIRIYYTDNTGQKAESWHCFYSGSVDGADTAHSTQVPQGQWTRYESDNLLDLEPAPRTIDKVEVYAFGWEFDGEVTNVQLIAQ